MPAAWFISYWQQRTNSISGPNLVLSIGLLISTLGFGAISPFSSITLFKVFYLILTGLLNLLDERSSITAELFPLVSGVGLGMLFHAPYQVFTRSLKQRDLAAGTSVFFLVRFTGATVGLVRVLIVGLHFFSQIPAIGHCWCRVRCSGLHSNSSGSFTERWILHQLYSAGEPSAT
jgi:phosphoglycerol transferase MdoB-like AlkP superfamily enzyme